MLTTKELQHKHKLSRREAVLAHKLLENGTASTDAEAIEKARSAPKGKKP